MIILVIVRALRRQAHRESAHPSVRDSQFKKDVNGERSITEPENALRFAPAAGRRADPPRPRKAPAAAPDRRRALTHRIDVVNAQRGPRGIAAGPCVHTQESAHRLSLRRAAISFRRSSILAVRRSSK